MDKYLLRLLPNQCEIIRAKCKVDLDKVERERLLWYYPINYNGIRELNMDCVVINGEIVAKRGKAFFFDSKEEMEEQFEVVKVLYA